MKRLWRVISVAALCAVAARAQAPLLVGYQKIIQVSVPGATAAYSLDSTIAEAGAANGVVEIQGRAPGATNIIVVTSAGTQALAVVVPQPPPSYPPGFEPPAREGATSERGSYEVRYTSDPAQLNNSVEFMRTQGDSFDRMQVTNATLFSSGSRDTVFGFPFASYEISRPRRDVTLIDQTVNNTPLTLDGYMVRGLHVHQGPWWFHAGFTSVAVFQGLFLSTDPEYTAGLSRSFSLEKGKYGSLEPAFYYFQNPRRELSVAPNGGLGSLAYRLRRKDRFSFLSELGVSHWGMAFAARGNYDDKRTHVFGNFRIVPQRFASLAINNQHGTFASLNATRDLNSRLFASFGLSQSGFNLPSLQQSTFTSSLNLTYKLTRNFSVSSGSAYSRFKSTIPLTNVVQALNLPVGIDFSSRHFGSGFQYQRTDNFDGSGGNDYAINLRGAAGQFLMSAFYRHDVQVPTLAAIFAQIPGLQDLLERAGIVVTNPDELAQLLQNSALLSTLGFTAPLTVNLAPVRNDLSASVNWMGKAQSHPQVGLSYFDSNTQLLQGSFRFSSGSLSYSQRVTHTNDVIASLTLLRTSGITGADTRPVFSLSLRHRFSSVPPLLLPGRHGVIKGHVFSDNESSAQYQGGKPGIGGVEVRLDDARVAHSDANGYYSFHHVPFGPHRVEAKFQSNEPFFYTTDSPAGAEINSTVDFGINFAKGQVFGFLLNDAGKGINGVTIELQGGAAPRMVQTKMDGKFSFPGLEPGTYSVSTQTASYPTGYALQDLLPVQVAVETGKPASLEIKVRAIRAVSGKVTAYDKTLLKPVPVPGVTVRLQELSQEVKTSATGAYVFRNLPAGTYTIIANYNRKEISRVVTVPADPANLRDMDLDVGSKEGP